MADDDDPFSIPFEDDPEFMDALADAIADYVVDMFDGEYGS